MCTHVTRVNDQGTEGRCTKCNQTFNYKTSYTPKEWRQMYRQVKNEVYQARMASRRAVR